MQIKGPEFDHAFIGIWSIHEMEMWDKSYFNMEVQAFVEIRSDNLGDFQFGPLSFMLNYPDHCVLYRFIPRSITQTDMHVIWFVNGDAQEGKDYSTEAVSWLWHHTSQEDEVIIRRNNEGVNSYFFEPGPYQPEFEAICIDFVKWHLEAISQN